MSARVRGVSALCCAGLKHTLPIPSPACLSQPSAVPSPCPYPPVHLWANGVCVVSLQAPLPQQPAGAVLLQAVEVATDDDICCLRLCTSTHMSRLKRMAHEWGATIAYSHSKGGSGDRSGQIMRPPVR